MHIRQKTTHKFYSRPLPPTHNPTDKEPYSGLFISDPTNSGWKKPAALATSFTRSLVTSQRDSTHLWLLPAQRAGVWTIQVLLSRLHCRLLPLRYLLFSSFFFFKNKQKKDRLISQNVIWMQYSKAKRMLEWKPKHLVGNCSCRLTIEKHIQLFPLKVSPAIDGHSLPLLPSSAWVQTHSWIYLVKTRILVKALNYAF